MNTDNTDKNDCPMSSSEKPLDLSNFDCSEQQSALDEEIQRMLSRPFNPPKPFLEDPEIAEKNVEDNNVKIEDPLQIFANESMAILCASHINCRERSLYLCMLIKSWALQSTMCPMLLSISYEPSEENQFRQTLKELREKFPELQIFVRDRPLLQFEHYKLLINEQKEQLERRWLLFADDDDLMHPARVTMYASAMMNFVKDQKHGDADTGDGTEHTEAQFTDDGVENDYDFKNYKLDQIGYIVVADYVQMPTSWIDELKNPRTKLRMPVNIHQVQDLIKADKLQVTHAENATPNKYVMYASPYRVLEPFFNGVDEMLLSSPVIDLYLLRHLYISSSFHIALDKPPVWAYFYRNWSTEKQAFTSRLNFQTTQFEELAKQIRNVYFVQHLTYSKTKLKEFCRARQLNNKMIKRLMTTFDKWKTSGELAPWLNMAPLHQEPEKRRAIDNQTQTQTQCAVEHCLSFGA